MPGKKYVMKLIRITFGVSFTKSDAFQILKKIQEIMVMKLFCSGSGFAIYSFIALGFILSHSLL